MAIKIPLSVILHVLRLILCNEEVQKFLKARASETETPLDDIALNALVKILCK